MPEEIIIKNIQDYIIAVMDETSKARVISLPESFEKYSAKNMTRLQVELFNLTVQTTDSSLHSE